MGPVVLSPPESGSVTPELKRRANDLMRSAALERIETPFFCECDDPDCLRPVWLTGLDYDRLRALAGWRPLAPGHTTPRRAA